MNTFSALFKSFASLNPSLAPGSESIERPLANHLSLHVLPIDPFFGAAPLDAPASGPGVLIPADGNQ